MKMFGYGNLLATMSRSNPRLTRKIFSQVMNNRVDSSSKKVKTSLSEYDKIFSDDYGKKISDDTKKFAAQMTQTPLYTSKLQTDYYSTIGGLFNYLL
ncbi:MAG: hypothetical protein IJS81_00575 [Selenomonadaceae bacterium]|nr:hypothetical protein [Selenomonadaceae bacterium]